MTNIYNVAPARPEAAPEMGSRSLLMALTTVTTAGAVSHLARALMRGIFTPHFMFLPSSLVLIASHARLVFPPCAASLTHLAH